MNFVFSLLRFLGFQDESPPIRKNYKRYRVYDDFLCDDFSSDDETVVLGLRHKQFKRFRSEISTNERHYKKHKCGNHEKNVEQIKSSPLSTPQASYNRTVTVVPPELSRNGPSSLPFKKIQKEPNVAWVDPKKNENTEKDPSIEHVTLDDDDIIIDNNDDTNKNQQDDDVVFVKQVNTPTLKIPHKPFHAESINAAGLNSNAKSNVLEEITLYDNRDYQKKNKPMSKRKPIVDDKLAKGAALRVPQTTRTCAVNKMNLDNKLNAEIYQNEPKEHDPVIVSSTDFSDSDVEVVPPESTNTSLIKKDTSIDIAGKSRNWLLDEDSKYNNLQRKQENNNDARQGSDITSNSTSELNEARSSSPETIKDWLEKLDKKYFFAPKNASENQNEHQNLSEQNTPQSYKQVTTGDKLLRLESKNNIGLLKSQEKLNDPPQESKIVSKVNTEQNIAHSKKPDNIKLWLTGLESTYFSTPQKVLGDLTRQESNIVPGMDNEQDDDTFNLNTSRDPILKAELEYETDLYKTLEEFVQTRPETDIFKLNREENEPGSNLPNISRERLSKLHDEQLFCLCCSQLECKHKADLLKTQEEPDEVCRESVVILDVDSEQNEARSYKPDTTDQRSLRLDSKHKTKQAKTEEKLNDEHQEENNFSKVNSKQNALCSFNSNDSEDWMFKLGTLFKKYQQETREKYNNAQVKPDYMLQVNYEREQNQSQVGSNLPNVSRERLSKLHDGQLFCLCCSQLECKYKADLLKTQEEPDEVCRESVVILDVDSEQNEARSYKPDTTDQRSLRLDPKHKTKQAKTEEKLNDEHQEENNFSKVNSKQNALCSFNSNDSEDWMFKLGTQLKKYQQETREKNNNARLRPDYMLQVSYEREQNQSNFELPALTPDQEELVDRALEPEPQEEVLIEKFNITIRRRDLQTLWDLNWLNDEVINFYMNLVMQRSQERKDLPKVYATNTFFYPKLMQSGQAGLRRWTRKVDIFSYDLFIVPVNVAAHWCLSIIDFRTRKINYLDSQGATNHECLDALLQYLKDEHRDKKGASFDDNGWQAKCPKDIPQQMNGSDCGMFACTFAEFSSRNAAYSFTQAHMPYLRRKAALEILSGKLLL